ncbi:MAG: hypothetical protein RBR74_12310 [Ignavibacteriaceae bacterium]|jgi:hypothetical protein|nr:hypothetical protein [Ignavibacteriaceae bacterium]
MITAFIFFIHLIFALVIFTKKWQDDNLASGLQNLAFIGIFFAVGWSITGLIAKLIMDQEGLGIQFDRDTFSLTLLTLIEFFFYKFYYKEEPTADDKEKQ